jgi:transketolase
MRRAFTGVMTKILEEDENSILLLGDIGVHGFRSSLEKFPERAINFGIMEQTMISFAAGLSKEGFNPTVHTIAPFLVERAYEQLKIDFGYQKLSGNFVSVGASVDYSALGCTHHCPGDVSALLNIPGFEIFIPGTSEEFSKNFESNFNNEFPSYFRLSELENEESFNTDASGYKTIKYGKKLTLLLIGPVLQFVPKSIFEMDIEIVYINKISAELFVDKNIINN